MQPVIEPMNQVMLFRVISAIVQRETHYHDMLIVAISIQKGKVKASTVLRKLCPKSRKNKLYFAFRELGRVERTIFLLNYIDDPEMRRLIQAATCKSEEFNQFVSWIRFGGGGVISDNMRPNQRKIIRFNHLLRALQSNPQKCVIWVSLAF